MATRSPMKSTKETDVTAPSDEKLDFDDDTLRAIADVYLHEGNSEYRKKELNNAVYFYTEGIQVCCKDDKLIAKLYSNRATAHFYLGNHQETLNDAKAAIQLEPSFIKAIERGASACVELYRFAEAIAWCDKGLAIDSTNKELLALRTRSVQEVNKLHRATQEKVNSAPEGHAVESEATRSPMKATKETDVTAKSDEKLDFDDGTLRAIAEVYLEEANSEYRKKELNNAVFFYTEGIQVGCKDDKLNAKLYSNRATAHFYLGNHQETLNDAKAAIQLEPTFIKAIERGASACLALHQFDEAITWCDKGLVVSF